MQNPSQTENLTLAQIVESGVKLTPMMEQYFQVKKQYPDILLMFRMGDFYEMFFEDAREASRILNISLTVRGKLADYPIPMAGIPHHAASSYIDRISNTGKKVVICEQLEDPKMAKGIVKRGVTQIVSPGIPYDLDKALPAENKFMASACYDGSLFYLILLDYTTGDFLGTTFPTIEELSERLLLTRPKEFITFLGQWDAFPQLDKTIDSLDVLKTHLSSEYFLEKHTSLYIQKLVSTYEKDGVLNHHPALLGPLGALSYYVCSTQSIDKISHIRPFRFLNNEDSLKVTYATLSGLEILPRSQDLYQKSLLGFMDRTKTSMGARHLKQYFQNPLRDIESITKRLNTLESLVQNPELIQELRKLLVDVRDIDRIMAKISTHKAVANDILNLARAFNIFNQIENMWAKSQIYFFQPLAKKSLGLLEQMSNEVGEFISEELGAHYEKGNLIKQGSHKERDRLFKLAHSASEEILKLELKYRSDTGIGNLKIKHNNISGYFIEVSNSHLSKVPTSFKRRQTLVNNERYITDELEDFEKEVTQAQNLLIQIEKDIFENICNKFILHSTLILDVAKRIAQVDVFQSFAWVALQENFCKPSLKEDEKIIAIKSAWHPLIKASIKDKFITHDIHLNDDKFFALITGPNMAGKTTVMREVAIIQFLSQLGSFVPASSAELGVCDYLFSRLGASDDIIRGQSTFMVEMSETAEIIRHATDRSLIILDEIGRGTSTYDGLSIAWALVEHFVVKIKAITLFATHYHELIEVASSLPGAGNFTVRTEQKNGKVQFMYELIEAAATQSFGIHVAELAGLPREILKRSRSILKDLEGHAGIKYSGDQSQLSLFHPPETASGIPESLKEIEDSLRSIDISQMTPLQALIKLESLKSRLQD